MSMLVNIMNAIAHIINASCNLYKIIRNLRYSIAQVPACAIIIL